MKKAMKSMHWLKVSCIFLRISKFLFLYFNQNGKEGNEIDEKKGQHEEGNEIDEKKGHHEAPQSHESVSDREGQARQVFSFSWSQGQDIGGIEEAGSHQKQVGKSRIQKNERSGQVSIQKKRIGQVECCMSKGAKRFETQRIRSYWWQNVAGKGFSVQDSLVLQKVERLRMRWLLMHFCWNNLQLLSEIFAID